MLQDNKLNHFARLLVFMTIIAFIGNSELQSGHNLFLPQTQNELVIVNFCDLLKAPEKYDGKQIETTANLVATIEPVLDGGDSYLYHFSCIGTLVMCNYGFTNPPTSRIGRLLKKYFFSSKKGNHGQAEVVLRGRFETAKGSGFGHLDFFKYKIDLSEILSAKESRKR